MSSTTPELFTRLLDDYLSCINTPSPPDRPFDSFYRGRDILDNFPTGGEAPWAALVKIAKGVNLIETEELGAGARMLEQAIEELEYDPLPSSLGSFGFLVQSGYNALALVWANRNSPEKSLILLRKAQQTFFQYSPIAPSASLVSAHTRTLFFLAQIYSKLRVRALSALYCHLCLRRQLADHSISNSEFVKNCLGLALFYSGANRFPQAWRVLTACQKFVDEGKFLERQQDGKQEMEKSYEEAAELARGWAAFHLKRFQASREKFKSSSESRLSKAAEDDEEDEEGGGPEILPTKEETSWLVKELCHEGILSPDVDNPQLDDLQVDFLSLELPETPDLSLFDDLPRAIECFRAAQPWFERTLNYFILDGYVSDHITISQEFSQLYRCLIAYEEKLERICKLEKRRIDLLTPPFQQLSQAAYLEFYQQLADELGCCYGNLCEAKLKLMPMVPQDKKAAAQLKINQLALKGSELYQLWIGTWFDSRGALKFPDLDHDIDYQRWFFLAHFSAARLLSKVFHEDRNILNQFLQRALSFYQKCVEFAKKWPNLQDRLKGEIEVAEELTIILPRKMDKILAHGAFQ